MDRHNNINNINEEEKTKQTVSKRRNMKRNINGVQGNKETENRPRQTKRGKTTIEEKYHCYLTTQSLLMPLYLPMPFNIVLPPVVLTLRAKVFILGDPTATRLVGMMRPHVPMQVLALGLFFAANIATAGTFVVVFVFAVL